MQCGTFAFNNIVTHHISNLHTSFTNENSRRAWNDIFHRQRIHPILAQERRGAWYCLARLLDPLGYKKVASHKAKGHVPIVDDIAQRNIIIRILIANSAKSDGNVNWAELRMMFQKVSEDRKGRLIKRSCSASCEAIAGGEGGRGGGGVGKSNIF